MELDRQRLERCLAQVATYRASGLKAKVWAAAQGIELRDLQSWCSHATRWRARLDGVPPTRPEQPRGFIAAHVAPAAGQLPTPAVVRVELGAPGPGAACLHWPLTHTRELAALLRELVR